MLRPASGWMGRASQIRHQVHAYNEEKIQYDHYTRKVVTMREARDKRAQAGKPEKPKDVDKLVRVSDFACLPPPLAKSAGGRGCHQFVVL